FPPPPPTIPHEIRNKILLLKRNKTLKNYLSLAK
ncbi:lipopolysaccharide biosynthesis protein, partial [Helicobacter pylori]